MRFDTSNNELERPKKVIGLMKDELGGKLMTEFSILRPKTKSYLHKPTIKKNDEDNPRKNHKQFIKNNKFTLKSVQRFKARNIIYLRKKLKRLH